MFASWSKGYTHTHTHTRTHTYLLFKQRNVKTIKASFAFLWLLCAHFIVPEHKNALFISFKYLKTLRRFDKKIYLHLLLVFSSLRRGKRRFFLRERPSHGKNSSRALRSTSNKMRTRNRLYPIHNSPKMCT